VKPDKRGRVRAIVATIAALFMATGHALAVEVGDKAPAFALPTAQGETISLERLHGRMVFVDFWASWCGPCRRSFPWMNELQQRYGERGLTIVAINVDKRREDADRFLRQYPASFAVVYDAAGATPGAFDVKAMPSSYVIDREGRIAAIERGYRDDRGAELEARIRSMVDARK
jgi:thiol-disulfide isomerase/thioredoxin